MPDVTYDKKHGLLYCRLRRAVGQVSTVQLADEERTVEADREHPERIGQTLPAYSDVMVMADYDEEGTLCGVEIIGLPAKKPTAINHPF